MQLAIVAAGFSPGEADGLRRAMAAWKRKGGLEPFQKRLIDGMRARGYPESFAQQIFNQILGFGEYGFPESHAASFALLVYTSAWLKASRARRVLRRAHQQPAHGFLRTGAVRARCARARRRGAAGRRRGQRLGLHARAAGRRPPGAALGPAPGEAFVGGGRPAVARRARRAPLRQHRGSRRARRARPRRSRGAGGRRRARGPRRPSASRRMAGERGRACAAAACLQSTAAAEGIPLLRAPREGQDIVADYGSTGSDPAPPSGGAAARERSADAASCPTRSCGSSRTADR